MNRILPEYSLSIQVGKPIVVLSHHYRNRVSPHPTPPPKHQNIRVVNNSLMSNMSQLGKAGGLAPLGSLQNPTFFFSAPTSPPSY